MANQLTNAAPQAQKKATPLVPMHPGCHLDPQHDRGGCPFWPRGQSIYQLPKDSQQSSLLEICKSEPDSSFFADKQESCGLSTPSSFTLQEAEKLILRELLKATESRPELRILKLPSCFLVFKWE